MWRIILKAVFVVTHLVHLSDDVSKRDRLSNFQRAIRETEKDLYPESLVLVQQPQACGSHLTRKELVPCFGRQASAQSEGTGMSSFGVTYPE